MNWYRLFIKPSADFVLASLMVILLWPIFLGLWLVGSLTFKQAIFRQLRIGRNNKAFTCIKFKSLLVDGNEQSITNWGKFLRQTSLDELPQIINILRGEMSFVGPRPLLPEYLEHYSERQRKRHEVKPGITGLAQVNGRNRLSWAKSLEFDAQYAERISLITDLRILTKTIPQLFKIQQVNQSKNVSREPFHKTKTT